MSSGGRKATPSTRDVYKRQALVLAVLIWTFLKMDDKITALQKRVDELEAAQKTAEESEK